MGNTLSGVGKPGVEIKTTTVKMPPPPPRISVGVKPTGAKSDQWEGVGTHSNPAAYESKPGVTTTSPNAIAVGENQIANLHPQVTRVRVDPQILFLQDPAFKTDHPAAFKTASAQLEQLKHLTSLATQHGGRADLCL